MSAKRSDQERTCPGERYTISLAICRTRQRNQYPKCLLCPHRSTELMGSMASDPKVKASIFRATSVLGRVPQEINEYVMRKVGLGAAQFLRAEQPSGSCLVVGSDLRESSRGFARIFCEGANRGGMDTLNAGAVPPELVAFVLGTDGQTGGAFIGGGNYADSISGVRLWRGDLTPVAIGSGLEKVGLIARRLRTGCSRLPGTRRNANPVPDYVAYVRKFVPKPASLKVVVDGGYGTAGRLLEAVLSGLPIETVPCHFDEDGRNPFLGRIFPCNALTASVRAEVQRAKAHFGAAIDFDGERIAFFDERGRLLRHDAAAGLIAAELLARTPGASVTYDLRSTAALRARVERDGGRAIAAPAGRLPLAQHFRRNDSLYGADLGGLHYFKDFFHFASPVIALLMFCSHVSREQRRVSDLAADLTQFSQSDELTIATPSPEAAQEVIERVKDEFQGAERELIDGLTVRFAEWWFNLRQRGQTAELLLNVEGRKARDERRGRQTVERLVTKILSGIAA